MAGDIPVVVEAPDAVLAVNLPQLTTTFQVVPKMTASISVILPQLTPLIAAEPVNVATIRIKYSVNMGPLNYAMSGAGGVVVPARKGAYIFNDPSINVATGGATVAGAATVVIPSNFLEVGEGGMSVTGAASVRSFSLNPQLAVKLPAMLVAFGEVQSGILALTAPRMRVVMEGLVGRLGTLALTAPSMRVSMSGGESGVAVTFPAITLALSGNQVYPGTLDVRAPAMLVAMDGNAANVGTIDMRLPATTVEMSGSVATSGDLAVTLRAMRAELTGNMGVAGNLAVSFPAMRVKLLGAQQITGTLAVTMPRMQVELLGTLRTQLMLMLVANTTTGALSTYEGMQVNSMCQFGDAVLFADATGIHVMDADADNDEPIAAAVQYGVLDMGTAMQKHVTDVYVGMRAAGDLTLSVGVDENAPYDYTLAPYGVATLKARRAPTGKGLRGKYWQFSIANTNGCDFDLDTIDISVADSARRI
jgi:hypothetical protein